MVAHAAISLRVSLTESCQFHCIYCRPAHAKILAREAATPPAEWISRITTVRRHAPIEKVRFTGGEPLLYPFLDEVVEGIRGLGIGDLALTTNAFLLASRAAELAERGLRRVNISLDSRNPKTFEKMTGAHPSKVLTAIDAAIDAGLEVKLNAVILRGVNDGELLDLLDYATDREVPIRFLELMPIGPTAKDFDELYVSGAEMKARLSERITWTELPYSRSETSRNFIGHWSDGREVRCGFILPTSTPFCDGCRRLRLSSDGKLVGCLAQPDRFDLDQIEEALAVKLRPQRFEDQRAMVSIGG